MKRAVVLAMALLAAGCASFDGHTLKPGQSTAREVEQVMGRPVAKRAGAQGETVYWYPQTQYGRANYAARIAPDGRLVAMEQRLTQENIDKIAKGWTADQVYDLLGPPFQPEVYARSQRESWTYPILLQGHGYPKWFVVYFSTRDRTVELTELMDDPTTQPRGIRRS